MFVGNEQQPQEDNHEQESDVDFCGCSVEEPVTYSDGEYERLQQEEQLSDTDNAHTEGQSDY